MTIIEYDSSNKETIILLYGGGLSYWNYKKEAELLKDEYRVILPILDGHFDSDSDLWRLVYEYGQKDVKW